MMNKADKFSFDERAQRPAAGLMRDDQMAARRDFQIGKAEYFALQTNARVVFIDRSDFADFDI
ncbi:MAG TPA: hypothetical protein VEO55_04390 [Candidatus Dormibacteraeota bacterium]|nr:hypothetical protein [Candidatus Dormibacteraeota bacterium]